TAVVADADFHQHLHRLSELRAAVSPGWALQAYRTLAEDDVREVVFRELLGEGGVFETFLRVENEQDPSPYLFALVAKRCSGVRPGSAAELREDGYHGKQSGQHGSLVSPQQGDEEPSPEAGPARAPVRRRNRLRVGGLRGWPVRRPRRPVSVNYPGGTDPDRLDGLRHEKDLREGRRRRTAPRCQVPLLCR